MKLSQWTARIQRRTGQRGYQCFQFLFACITRCSRRSVTYLLVNLSDLPPTLLQASEAEMLLDDSVMYFRKAYPAGSPVVLQTWADVVHVWQLFDPQVPQAREAWREIKKIIAEHSKT